MQELQKPYSKQTQMKALAKWKMKFSALRGIKFGTWQNFPGHFTNFQIRKIEGSDNIAEKWGENLRNSRSAIKSWATLKLILDLMLLFKHC